MTVFLYASGTLLAAPLLAMAFFHFFVGKALPQAKARLRSDEQVEYRKKNKWHIFRPRQRAVRCGYVLYQGGFVDAVAYAWLGHALARLGMLVVIPELPSRAAMSRPLEADAIIDAHPEVGPWFISGHSLGGIGAAYYAKRGALRARLAGSVILASFLRETRDMSREVSTPTLTLYGTRDGHAHKFEPNYKHFSSEAELVCIEGANHGQFGEYGFHLGDNPPEISRDRQQAAIVRHIDAFVTRLLRPAAAAQPDVTQDAAVGS